MMFEYKVVPAPTRGLKAKGVKSTSDRFANALQSLMNDLGTDGWEYQRTDTLPVEERQGLTGKTTTFQNMLVFRRTLPETAHAEPEIAALIEDQSDAPVEPPVEAPTVEDATPEPLAAVHEPDENAAPTDAKARLEETLKAETFSFPWDKRNKAPKVDTADKNLPAE